MRILHAIVRNLYTSLKISERWLLFAFVLAALGSVGVLWYRSWVATTDVVPIVGGSYREGVVASSLSDVTPTIDVLTNVGFVKFTADGELAPAAAEHWEVSADGKVYTLTLRADIDQAAVEGALQEREALFPNIQYEFQGSKLIFRLEQPFTPFLATLAEPILPLGPYQVADQQRGVIRFTPREQSIVGQPYIGEITLSIYLDGFNLTQALANDEIDGVADTSLVENPLLVDQLDTYTIELPRRIFVFFNTTRDPVKDVAIRRKLRTGEQLGEELALTVVTLANPRYEALARELADQWEDLGAAVTIETRTATELSNDVVPQRAYDALIYGLDFGGDPDPYPFWHSSQIGEEGLNLSNFAHIDADRILEKARQTHDQAERSSLYDQFQEIFDREVPAIELEQVSVTFGVSPSVQGVSSHAGLTVADRYKRVTDWYIKTQRVSRE